MIYDREMSAISLTEGSAYDWPSIFQGARWFHTTGITPAISRTAAEATMDAARAARAAGLTVSCDLNFRKKLWRWTRASRRAAWQRTRCDVCCPWSTC